MEYNTYTNIKKKKHVVHPKLIRLSDSTVQHLLNLMEYSTDDDNSYDDEDEDIEDNDDNHYNINNKSNINLCDYYSSDSE